MAISKPVGRPAATPASSTSKPATPKQSDPDPGSQSYLLNQQQQTQQK